MRQLFPKNLRFDSITRKDITFAVRYCKSVTGLLAG
jgi:hypothetical protein